MSSFWVIFDYLIRVAMKVLDNLSRRLGFDLNTTTTEEETTTEATDETTTVAP